MMIVTFWLVLRMLIWAENRDDRKSNSGFIFKVYGGSISWCCRKQSCVSLSSTEAEFVSLAEACQEVIWIIRLLNDLNVAFQTPITIFEDNQSCLKLVENEKYSNRTKHIDTKYNFIKQLVETGTIVCKYLPSENMLADLLTKPLNGNRIKYLRKSCGLIGNE